MRSDVAKQFSVPSRIRDKCSLKERMGEKKEKEKELHMFMLTHIYLSVRQYICQHKQKRGNICTPTYTIRMFVRASERATRFLSPLIFLLINHNAWRDVELHLADSKS